MSDIEAIRLHQKAYLEEVKRRKTPIYYNVKGVRIKVNPEVFPPATDTRLLADFIETDSSERTLDLTTGSGVFSIIAGLQGASGLAVDINPQAVQNANENFSFYRVPMRALQSNLFQHIQEELFDQIFANGPFFEGDIQDDLDYACYGASRFLDNLFGNLRPRLKRNGKLLLVTSTWQREDILQKASESDDLRTKMVAIRFSEDGKRQYDLYEIRPRN